MATLAAAYAAGAPRADAHYNIAIAFDGHPAAASPNGVRAPWMADVAARIALDRGAQDAAATVSRSSLFDVASDSVDGRERLLVIARAAPGTLAAAALVSATLHATSTLQRVADADSAVPAATLARWERAPSTSSTRAAAVPESAGRWLWLAALLLLGAEYAMRRRTRGA